MFEEIAREYNVETFRGQGPTCGTVLLKYVDVWSGVPDRVRVQIHAVLLRRVHVVDEFTIAATEIQHSRGTGYPFREKPVNQDLPDKVAVFLPAGEPLAVYLLEVLGGMWESAHIFLW